MRSRRRRRRRLALAIRVAYSANGADVSAQVLQLKQGNPSVAMFVSYASDSILFMRTMKTLDYLPPMIIGNSAGFSDPAFLPAVGTISQGLMNRSVWSLGPRVSLSYAVNKIYQAKSGHEIDDVSGRCMQAFFVLADAMQPRRRHRPKQDAGRVARHRLAGERVFIGYRGVKFDATGQNILSATYLTQLQGKDYATVWPEAPGNATLRWPMTGWKA